MINFGAEIKVKIIICRNKRRVIFFNNKNFQMVNNYFGYFQKYILINCQIFS